MLVLNILSFDWVQRISHFVRNSGVNYFLEVFLGFYLLVHDAILDITEVDYFGFYVLKCNTLSFDGKYRPLYHIKIITKINLTFCNRRTLSIITSPALILNIQIKHTQIITLRIIIWRILLLVWFITIKEFDDLPRF